MIEKNYLEKILSKCLTTGADFAEIFIEESTNQSIELSASLIQKVKTYTQKGIGIRISLNNEIAYGYTDKKEDINKLIERLIIRFNKKEKSRKITLPNLKTYKDNIKIPHSNYPIEKKQKLLHNIDKIARNTSPKVNQVNVELLEKDQHIIVANTNNIYKEDYRTLSRLYIKTFVKEKETIETSSYTPGFKKGYEYLENLKLEEKIKETVQNALEKLNAPECPSGEMPAIIGNGFGGVIFHEACVHALEATTVAKGSSVFNDKLNTKIANPKVTIIDDGTIQNEWGSINIDDEGLESKKNILIKNGILTSYLVDYINSKIMNTAPTSSGRRESYKYAPTSRMTNTFLEKGKDNIDDMISSIDYGIYAKNMGGGSVDPKTGDFNFAVNEAYLIEKGKITTPIKGASLIGNGAEIIKRVSMVSADLSKGAGMCGSESGSIPVTVGQPTIKVDKILVGGKGEKINV